MIDLQRKIKRSVNQSNIISNIMIFGVISSEYFIPSYQTREIIGSLAAMVLLCCGLIVFHSIGLRCVAVILSPKRVTAYFDRFSIGTKNRWIEYHYSYNCRKYTGVGRAVDIHDPTLPNTPFPLLISRIDPRLSWHGDPRIAILPPLLILLSSALVAFFLAFITPQWGNFAHDIHLRARHLDVSATGMTLPFLADTASAWQQTTLHIENHSHTTIQINQLNQFGETVSFKNFPPGIQGDWPASSGTGWYVKSGTKVLCGLASTPQEGYVNIHDAE